MFCQNCGKEIDGDSKFCQFCGSVQSAEYSNKINSNSSSSSVEVKPNLSHLTKKYYILLTLTPVIIPLIFLFSLYVLNFEFDDSIVLAKIFSVIWVITFCSIDCKNICNTIGHKDLSYSILGILIFDVLYVDRYLVNRQKLIPETKRYPFNLLLLLLIITMFFSFTTFYKSEFEELEKNRHKSLKEDIAEIYNSSDDDDVQYEQDLLKDYEYAEFKCNGVASLLFEIITEGSVKDVAISKDSIKLELKNTVTLDSRRNVKECQGDLVVKLKQRDLKDFIDKISRLNKFGIDAYLAVLAETLESLNNIKLGGSGREARIVSTSIVARLLQTIKELADSQTDSKHYITIKSIHFDDYSVKQTDDEEILVELESPILKKDANQLALILGIIKFTSLPEFKEFEQESLNQAEDYMYKEAFSNKYSLNQENQRAYELALHDCGFNQKVNGYIVAVNRDFILINYGGEFHKYLYLREFEKKNGIIALLKDQQDKSNLAIPTILLIRPNYAGYAIAQFNTFNDLFNLLKGSPKKSTDNAIEEYFLNHKVIISCKDNLKENYASKYDFLSKERITKSFTNLYTKDDLYMMRNSIFASHNYIFKSEDLIKEFQKTNWYTPSTQDISGYNEFEKSNIKFIKEAENAK